MTVEQLEQARKIHENIQVLRETLEELIQSKNGGVSIVLNKSLGSRYSVKIDDSFKDEIFEFIIGLYADKLIKLGCEFDSL